LEALPTAGRPFGGLRPIVWPARRGTVAGPWVWSERIDMLWIAGGASLLFGAVAVPVSYLWAGFGPVVVATFLHLGVIVNYPHYAATYELAVRERTTRRRGFRWVVATSPLMFALAAAAVRWPALLVIPLARVYLTWSAFHYAAQHFGIASMYSAKGGRPLLPREKRPLQASFVGVAVYMMIALNMIDTDAETLSGATAGYDVIGAVLPHAIYPLAVTVLAASGAAFLLGNARLLARTGRGFDRSVWLLALTNCAWFVVPNIWLPGAKEPWLGALTALWVPIAVPFFHCVQYLGVAADRARSEQPLRPVLWMSSLVALGLLLFEATVWGLPRITSIAASQAVLIVTSILNIHHFVIDGVIWKRPTPGRLKPAPTYS
jgi:hypothetical protein